MVFFPEAMPLVTLSERMVPQVNTSPFAPAQSSSPLPSNSCREYSLPSHPSTHNSSVAYVDSQDNKPPLVSTLHYSLAPSLSPSSAQSHNTALITEPLTSFIGGTSQYPSASFSTSQHPSQVYNDGSTLNSNNTTQQLNNNNGFQPPPQNPGISKSRIAQYHQPSQTYDDTVDSSFYDWYKAGAQHNLAPPQSSHTEASQGYMYSTNTAHDATDIPSSFNFYNTQASTAPNPQEINYQWSHEYRPHTQYQNNLLRAQPNVNCENFPTTVPNYPFQQPSYNPNALVPSYTTLVSQLPPSPCLTVSSGPLSTASSIPSNCSCPSVKSSGPSYHAEQEVNVNSYNGGIPSTSYNDTPQQSVTGSYNSGETMSTYLNQTNTSGRSPNSMEATEQIGTIGTDGSMKRRKRRQPSNRKTSVPRSPGGKSFVCPECSKKFKRSEHLRRHIRSLHTSEKPFVCICGKRFSRRDNLRQHERLHVNASPRLACFFQPSGYYSSGAPGAPVQPQKPIEDLNKFPINQGMDSSQIENTNLMLSSQRPLSQQIVPEIAAYPNSIRPELLSKLPVQTPNQKMPLMNPMHQYQPYPSS